VIYAAIALGTWAATILTFAVGYQYGKDKGKSE